jgi:hypothetical protein
MSNDYMRTFKQSSLYYAFLQRGACGIGLNKSELHLRGASQYRYPVQIVVVLQRGACGIGLNKNELHLRGANQSKYPVQFFVALVFPLKYYT